jgi:hypothetical protein
MQILSPHSSASSSNSLLVCTSAERHKLDFFLAIREKRKAPRGDVPGREARSAKEVDRVAWLTLRELPMAGKSHSPACKSSIVTCLLRDQLRERQQYVELLLESRVVGCEEDRYREPPIALQ